MWSQAVSWQTKTEQTPCSARSQESRPSGVYDIKSITSQQDVHCSSLCAGFYVADACLCERETERCCGGWGWHRRRAVWPRAERAFSLQRGPWSRERLLGKGKQADRMKEGQRREGSELPSGKWERGQETAHSTSVCTVQGRHNMTHPQESHTAKRKGTKWE